MCSHIKQSVESDVKMFLIIIILSVRRYIIFENNRIPFVHMLDTTHQSSFEIGQTLNNTLTVSK